MSVIPANIAADIETALADAEKVAEVIAQAATDAEAFASALPASVRDVLTVAVTAADVAEKAIAALETLVNEL